MAILNYFLTMFGQYLANMAVSIHNHSYIGGSQNRLRRNQQKNKAQIQAMNMDCHFEKSQK